MVKAWALATTVTAAITGTGHGSYRQAQTGTAYRPRHSILLCKGPVHRIPSHSLLSPPQGYRPEYHHHRPPLPSFIIHLHHRHPPPAVPSPVPPSTGGHHHCQPSPITHMCQCRRARRVAVPRHVHCLPLSLSLRDSLPVTGFGSVTSGEEAPHCVVGCLTSRYVSRWPA